MLTITFLYFYIAIITLIFFCINITKIFKHTEKYQFFTILTKICIVTCSIFIWPLFWTDAIVEALFDIQTMI